MKFLRKKILILSILSISVFSSNSHWIGEKDFDIYYGPLDPALKNNYRLGSSIFLDDHFADFYFYGKTTPTLYNLNSFYSNNIASGFLCSINDYNKSENYIHYLHRLTAISLQYEFLKKIHISLYQVSESEKKCDLTYEEVFKSCKPKTEEMKKFVKRVDQFFPDIIDWGNYPLLRKYATFSNLEKYQKSSTQIVQKYFPDDNVENSFLRACQKVKAEIQALCSEKDTYFGMSKFSEIQNQIENSSAFKIINSEESGKACIEQFKEVNLKNEDIDYISNYVLKSEVTTIDKINESIYWYGSLKEFDDLGVEVVATQEVIIPKSIEVKKEVTPVVVSKNEPEVEKEVTKPKEVVVYKRLPDLIQTSAFHDALKEFKRTRRFSEFNMTKMKTDYKYSKKILQNLNGPLKPYQTRKALTDMKTIDRLGSINTPLSYLFLRFMVDYNLHQGLYNIKAILGDEFYIVNDIEKDKDIVKIRIDNNEQTKFKWQIWIIEASI